jgi:2-oxoglutarate ferredoxin oxidoreductase subunit alpha
MNPPDTLEAEPAAATATIVNDFSLEMATVNGTGSQSANNILAKTMFRMGIPVSAKNLFPSNIQGLPTWFTLRASKHGYTARKRERNWLVGMNAETWEKDVERIDQGAVVLYNSSDLLDTPLRKRPDLIVYPIPITELVKDNIQAPKLRRMLANVVYVGALAELLSMDWEVLEDVVRDTFAKKPKAVDVNLQALKVGADYVRENLPKRDAFRLETMQANDGKILIDGNSIAALGCLMGGCTVVGWYPITPSSSLCETLIQQFRRYRVDPATGEHRYADVQMEDELASIGMVLGAGWAGARSMTATAGPGISLMGEFIGFGYYAEIPAVIFDVQRIGPSTGLPTRTSQGDVLACVYGSHGDTEHICLFPGGPEECYDFGRISFDLADRFQTPIFVLTDLDLGMNFWMSDRPEYPTEGFDRGKVLSAAELEKAKTYGRYLDVDGDGIPYRTLPGNKNPLASYFTRGSGHDEYARYTEDGDDFARNMARLSKKLETARKEVPRPLVDLDADAKVGLIAYGSTEVAMREARDQLQNANIPTSYLRIRATPIARDEIGEFIRAHDRVYIIDQNRDGQMEMVLRNNFKDGSLTDRFRSIRHYTGMPIDALTISESVVSQETDS